MTAVQITNIPEPFLGRWRLEEDDGSYAAWLESERIGWIKRVLMDKTKLTKEIKHGKEPYSYTIKNDGIFNKLKYKNFKLDEARVEKDFTGEEIKVLFHMASVNELEELHTRIHNENEKFTYTVNGDRLTWTLQKPSGQTQLHFRRLPPKK